MILLKFNSVYNMYENSVLSEWISGTSNPSALSIRLRIEQNQGEFYLVDHSYLKQRGFVGCDCGTIKRYIEEHCGLTRWQKLIKKYLSKRTGKTLLMRETAEYLLQIPIRLEGYTESSLCKMGVYWDYCIKIRGRFFG